MSIESAVDDAIALRGARRYEGALTSALIAVAGSSRKLYPNGTASLTRPATAMGDGEAFKSFLGARLSEVIFDCNFGFATSSGVALSFRGKEVLFEEILYSHYRCELVHKCELPQDV